MAGSEKAIRFFGHRKCIHQHSGDSWLSVHHRWQNNSGSYDRVCKCGRKLRGAGNLLKRRKRNLPWLDMIFWWILIFRKISAHITKNKSPFLIKKNSLENVLALLFLFSLFGIVCLNEKICIIMHYWCINIH